MASSASSVRSRKPRPKLLGSTTPRIWTKPLKPLEPRSPTTEKRTLGYQVVDFSHDVLMFPLLPWQIWLFVHMLELRPDGRLRFRKILVLIARQNGKSTISVVLALWVMYVLGLRTVIGTAQDLDTAEEIWGRAVDLVQELDDDEAPVRPELAALVKSVFRVNGKKSLELKTGERYRVKAANRRAGRSFTADLVLLDELREHQSWDAWGAITKTTTARPKALILALSNAGDVTSVVLRHLRQLAHQALGDPDGICKDALPIEEPDDFDLWEDEFGDDLAIFEWSAPPGCGKWDRPAWAQANPSLGFTIEESTIASDARTDPDWVFRPEVLCQWVDRAADGPFPEGSWEATLDPGSKITLRSQRVWGLDVSWNRSTAHISVAGFRADGDFHGEHVVAMRPDQVVAWFDAKPRRKDFPVVVQKTGAPASSLIQELRDAGITVVEWGGPDLGKGSGLVYDSVRVSVEAELRDEDGKKPRQLWHLDQPLLTAAAAAAAVKAAGDGVWIWDRAKSSVDIAPLVALTAALWWLSTMPPPKKPAPQPALVSASPRAPASAGRARDFDPQTASF